LEIGRKSRDDEERSSVVAASSGARPRIGNARMTGTGGSALTYKVILAQSDEGFSVSCPGLPGCWSQGETEGEALANIREAIQEYLAVRDELLPDGQVREVDVTTP